MENGCCGAWLHSDGACHWKVWAPHVRAVDLILDSPVTKTVAMTAVEENCFTGIVPQIGPGQLYWYQLDGELRCPDPCSHSQPRGVFGPSEVVDHTPLVRPDAAWKGMPAHDLVIYELHVGTFTPEGTFAAILPRLDELSEIGITALEIMPVAEFSGDRNWGYDGVFPYAVHHRYGGPTELKRLVEGCHAKGIAVFLDVVYNHFGPEGSVLAKYAPYVTDRYRTPWGGAVNFDGPDSDGVRNFVVENVRYWLRHFHFDGLRLDAVHAIFDAGPQHILTEIKNTADQVSASSWRRLIIAESDLNDPRLLREQNVGGYGLDLQWTDDFHHAVHAALTGEQRGYYADFGDWEQLVCAMASPYLYAGHYSRVRRRRHGARVDGLPPERFVVCIQNHDQIGNRASGDRLSSIVGDQAQRLAACLLLLSPYTPLLFMGEEYGETNPFPYFCSFNDHDLIEAVRRGRLTEFADFVWGSQIPDPQDEGTFESAQLSWSWPQGSKQAGVRMLYKDLLKLRRELPEIRRLNDRKSHAIGSILEVDIGRCRALFNLGAEEQPLPAGCWDNLMLTSEQDCYGGTKQGNDDNGAVGPYECLFYGPALLGHRLDRCATEHLLPTARRHIPLDAVDASPRQS